MGDLKLKYPACEICGERKTSRLFSIGGFNILKCLKCGLIYTSPRPSEDEMIKHYTGGKRELPPVARPRKVRQIFRQMWYAYITATSRKDPFMLEGYDAGRVLDVGCGFGESLKKLKEKGWQTYGIEINRGAAKHAQKFGKIFTCELSDAKFPNCFFDAVLLRHVLEHVHHPSKILVEVRRIMKDDGVLVIEVPDAESIEARIFKARWPLWNPPEHLYHFSRGTLGPMLRKTGFRILEMSNSPSPVGILGGLDKIIKANGRIDNPIFNFLFYPFTSLVSKAAPTYALRGLAQKSLNSPEKALE